MSTTPDNRVVNMSFNGDNFNTGVDRSDKAFSAFKQNIENNGGAISEALSSIESKLSAKGVAIATIVSKMTNSVMGELTKLSNKFVKNPISDGFDEYNTALNASFNMFTAVKNKGSSLKDVEATLQELNAYSDKTIYNFGQMTDNIAKFTTKGSTLKESSGIVIGMSNLAASAGVANDRLASATFQMSQLNDVMNLLDYTSLSTNNMDTEPFRNAMIAVASESGRMMSKFNGKGESNSAAEYFKKATEYGITFKDMISDKVFKKADFVEVMRQFAIETRVSQSTLDNLRASFKKTSATSPIDKKVLDQISAVSGDSAFADEMVRIGNVGGKTIKTLGGIAGEAMDVETYLKKAKDKGLTFEQMCKDTKFTVGDLQKALDRLSLAKTMWRAATEVRTFPQMITTIQESIGSIWGAMDKQIFGGLEQATALWTGLTNAITGMIAPLADAAVAALTFWNQNGGRTAVITGLCNAFNALADIVRPIGKAFKAVFAPLTGSDLVTASKKFEDFTAKLRPSKGVVEGIGSAFYFLFNVLKLGKDLLTFVFRVIGIVLSPLKQFGPVISQIGSMLGQLFTNIAGLATKGGPAATFTQLLITLLGKLSDALSAIVGGGLRFFGDGISRLTNWLKPATDATGIAVDDLQGIADSAKKTGTSIKDAVSQYVNAKGLTGDKAETMIKSITGAVENLNKATGKRGTGSTFGDWLKNWTELLPKSFDDIMRIFDDIVSLKLVSLANKVGQGIGDAIQALKNPIKKAHPGSIIASLGALAVSLLVLSVSISRLAEIDFKSMAVSMGALGLGFKLLNKFIDQFAKTTKGLSPKQLIEMRGILKAVSLTILSLAVSLKILSGADPAGLMVGVVAMMVVVSKMAKVMKQLGTIGNPEKGAMALRTISVAVLQMSIGLRILANANTIKLAGAVMGISVVVKTFAKILDSLGGVGKAKINVLNTITLSIVAIALAMRVLATAKIGNVLAVTILMSVVLKRISVMIATLQGFKSSDKAIQSFAVLVSALGLLVASLALLAMADLKSILGAGMVLSHVIKSLNKTFKELPSNPSKKVENFKTLMNAVSLLAGALSILANAGFVKTIGAAIALKMVMKALSKTFENLPRNRNMTGVRDLAFGVSAMAVGLAVLATQRFGGMLGGAITLKMVIKATVEALNHLDQVRIRKGTILEFTGGIALMAVGLAVLAANPFGRQLSASIGLALVIKAVGEAMQNADRTKIDKKSIFAFTGGIALMAAGLAFLAINPIGKQLMAGLGMAAVVLAVGKAMQMVTKLKVDKNSILVFSAGVALMALGMSTLAASGGAEALGAGVAMAATIIAIAAALRIVAPVAKDALMISAALLVVSGAMYVMAQGMAIMANVPVLAIVASLLSFIAVLGLLAGAAMLLGPLVPVMLAIGGAVALVGVGIAGIGAGALMGIKALEKFINLIANAPGTITKAAENMGQVKESLKSVVIGIGEVIGVAMTSIVTVVVTAVVTLLQELGRNAGAFASAGMQLMIAFLNGMLPYIAELTKVGVEIIAQIIYGLSQGMPILVDSAIILLLTFLSSLVDSINDHLQDIADIGTNLVITILKAIAVAIKNSITLFKRVGGALWKALLAAVNPRGKGWESAFTGLISDLDNMTVAVDLGVTSIDKIGTGLDKTGENAKQATELIDKLSNAFTGMTGSVDNFKTSIAGYKSGGGIGALIGMDTSKQMDAISAESLLPDGSFSGEATGEATGEAPAATKIATGMEEAAKPKSKAAKKTKAATKKLVDDNIIAPLSTEGAKAQDLAEDLGNGMMERIIKGFTATVPEASVAAYTQQLTPLVRATIEKFQTEAEKAAVVSGKKAFYQKIIDDNKAITDAWDANQAELQKKKEAKELAAAKKAGGATLKAYQEAHKTATDNAINMSKEDIDKLKAASEQAVIDMATLDRQEEIKADVQSQMDEINDTWLGSLNQALIELGIVSKPANDAVATVSTGIDAAAKTIANANMQGQLATISNGLGIIGKMVPNLSEFTTAFGDFAMSLSKMKPGSNYIVQFTQALSTLGSALMDIAISKMRQVIDAMEQIATAAAQGISDMVTTNAQITVDVVVDVSSWVLKGGEGELPDLGDILGKIVDQGGGAAIDAGKSIADSAIGGMLEVFGMGAFSGVASAFTGMLGTLGKMITSALGKLIPIVHDAIKNLTRKMMPGWMLSYIDSFQKIFKKFFNKLFGESINGDEQAKWFREHGAQMGEVFIEGLGSTTTAGGITSETGNWLTQIANKLKKSGGVFGLLAGELVDAFAKAWIGFNGWFSKIGESITGLISAGASGNVSAIYAYVLDFIYNLTNGFFGKKIDLKNIGKDVPGWLLGDRATITEGVKKFLRTILDVLTLGIFTKGSDAIFIGKMLNDRIVAGLASTPQEALRQILSGLISSMFTLLGDMIPQLILLGFETQEAIFDGMMDFIKQGGFGKIVWAIIQGLWDGFFKSDTNIFDIGWKIADSLWEGFLIRLGIHSPSTVFKSGARNCILGVAEGLEDIKPVEKAMTALEKAMEQGLTVIEGGSPTITPIVNLDDAAKKAKLIQGMFGGVEVSADLANTAIERQNGTGTGKTVEHTTSKSVALYQTINSPTPLSPRQIYRETGSLLETYKERLAK